MPWHQTCSLSLICINSAARCREHDKEVSVLTLKEGSTCIELQPGKAKGLSLKSLGIPLSDGTRIKKGQLNEFLQVLEDDAVGRRYQNIRATLVEADEGGQTSLKLFLQFEVFGDDNVPVEPGLGVVPTLLAGDDILEALPRSDCFLPYAGSWYDNQLVFDLNPALFDRASQLRLTAVSGPVRRL